MLIASLIWLLYLDIESSRKAYIKNKRKLDMLTEGALNVNTDCKVRRVDCVKDEVNAASLNTGRNSTI